MIELALLAVLFSLGPLVFYFAIATFSHRFICDESTSPNGARTRNRPICISPGCVRCNRNTQELCLALERFQKSKYSGQAHCARIGHALQHSAGSELFLRMELDEERPIWRRQEQHLPHMFCENLALLERKYASIANECEKALDFGHLWRRNDETQSGSTWFTYSLINQGAWQEQQCKECPRLTSLLHRLDCAARFKALFAEDGVLLTECLFGNVFISMLPANSTIAEHRGLTNARLRVHFGVQVPKMEAERCHMTVGGEVFHWREGEAEVIDDSFPHSVSSIGCPQDRVVLVLDFWHPNLSSQERNCLQKIFPAIYT